MADDPIRTLDTFIDESEVNINGKQLLIYGIVIPRNLNKAISEFLAMKKKYNLPPCLEVKWALHHPDPELKATIKEIMLDLLASNFLCLVNITEGRDKDVAFINVTRQIEMFMRETGRNIVNIYYDTDSFRDIRKIKAYIGSWKDIYCAALARMDSEYSIAVQFADMLAGTFRYMIQANFGGYTKTVKYIDDGLTEEEDVDLDELFNITLRWSMWGKMPYFDFDSDAEFTPEHQMQDCFGTGVIINGNFTEEEINIFKGLSKFYRGCMH